MRLTAYEASSVEQVESLSAIHAEQSPIESFSVGKPPVARNSGGTFLPVDLAEANPNLVDRVLDVLDGRPLPKPAVRRGVWGKYQTLALRRDGEVMKPFRG